MNKEKKMASSLEIVKFCGFSPVSISRHKSPVKLESRKRVFRLTDSRSCRRLGRCVRVYSSSLNGDNQSKGQLLFLFLLLLISLEGLIRVNLILQ